MSSVIVVGSSIVSVSTDTLPRRSTGERQQLFRVLAGNCEELSQLSESSDMGKDTRNKIAAGTFDLAKVSLFGVGLRAGD